MFKALFKNRQNSPSKFATIDAHTLQQRMLLGEKLTLFDVRSADEYASGHIAGARLLPLPSISQRHHEIPRDQPVIVSCRSGARSKAAIQQLLTLGFTNLTNLDGGAIAWQRAGLELVQ